MQIFNISVPDKPLTNIELVRYARLLKIPDFRGVFMRDTLPKYPFNVESGIVNFNASSQPGSHWVCYYRNKNERIYFDSYGQIPLVKIQRYIKKVLNLIVKWKLYGEIQISYKLRVHQC